MNGIMKTSLDNFGPLTAHGDFNAGPHYNFRKLGRYCREHGIEPNDLPPEKLAEFKTR